MTCCLVTNSASREPETNGQTLSGDPFDDGRDEQVPEHLGCRVSCGWREPVAEAGSTRPMLRSDGVAGSIARCTSLATGRSVVGPQRKRSGR